ncbi:hypothetical protein ACFL9S_07200, partial [Erwinia sp. AnSW2-5]
LSISASQHLSISASQHLSISASQHLSISASQHTKPGQSYDVNEWIAGLQDCRIAGLFYVISEQGKHKTIYPVIL